MATKKTTPAYDADTQYQVALAERTEVLGQTFYPGADLTLRGFHHEELIDAQELRAMGVNFNLAPVVDVNNNPNNPVIGVRSYGDDPRKVADYGLVGDLFVEVPELVAAL